MYATKPKFAGQRASVGRSVIIGFPATQGSGFASRHGGSGDVVRGEDARIEAAVITAVEEWENVVLPSGARGPARDFTPGDIADLPREPAVRVALTRLVSRAELTAEFVDLASEEALLAHLANAQRPFWCWPPRV